MKSCVPRIASRFHLPEAVVERVLSEPVEILLARNDYDAPSNTEAPTLDFPRHDIHTPRTARHSDPMERYLDYIEIINPFEVIPSEPEDRIRSHPTFGRYTHWFRQGMLPPYPAVFEQIHDGVRKLLGANRRRILTAREAGIERLPVWLGRWNRETRLPLKLGDILLAAVH